MGASLLRRRARQNALSPSATASLPETTHRARRCDPRRPAHTDRTPPRRVSSNRVPPVHADAEGTHKLSDAPPRLSDHGLRQIGCRERRDVRALHSTHPDSEGRTVQGFIFNVFGCIDNLAHIWVEEKRVKKPNGKEVPDSAVGFGEKNSDVLKSLPEGFRRYITSSEHQQRRRQIGDFRNALAHRIPLYIPPFVVRSEDMNELNRVGYLASDAVESGDYPGACNLMDEQRRIGEFVPAVSHSFAEGSRQILFHAQVLADFNTVAKVARRLHSELCG